MSLIGEGNNGYVYHPPLPCIDEKLNMEYGNLNYVMKVSNLREDLVFEAKLQQVDSNQDYFIYIIAICPCLVEFTPPRFTSSQEQWSIVRLDKPIYASYMRYGGIDLEKYMEGIGEEYPYLTVDQYITASNHLLEGLRILYDEARLSHQDIRSANILVGPDFVFRLTDFDYSIDQTVIPRERQVQQRYNDYYSLAKVLLELSQYVVSEFNMERIELDRYKNMLMEYMREEEEPEE